jgi:hypothetical protein
MQIIGNIGRKIKQYRAYVPASVPSMHQVAIVAAIVLVGSASFGLGRLSALARRRVRTTRTARVSSALALEEQAELDRLVEAEVQAATERAAALRHVLAP